MNKRSDKPAETKRDKPAPVKGLRKWVYVAIASVLIPAVFFGLLEAGLRIAGYGYKPGFLIKAGDFYESNPRFGWQFFPRDVSRAPLPIHLPIDKPAGTYRILVVGGSAARGYPDAAFSFSRYLDVMLRASYPGTRFEVANAAMTAANSHMMLPAARQCAKLKADLLIVYMGNNEVVGPYGPGTVFAGPSSSLGGIRTGLWLKGTRVGQLLGNTVGALAGGKGSAEWRGMAMFLENLVPADDARLTDTYSHFRRNLQDICRAGLDAGAAVAICTVPVNLRQCAPFASTHRDGLAAADLANWQDAYDQGAAQEQAGSHQQAIEHFTAALAIDDRSADLHFRMGRCYVELGNTDEAREHFRLARELDALRFRADATINDTIRQVARESDGQVMLADAERAFETVAGVVAASPGEELFFDHVHPNYRGNYEMARSVFQAVAAQLPMAATAEGNVQPPSFQRCNELLALTHLERTRNAASLWQLTRNPPFTNQLNYTEVRKRMQARRQALLATTVRPADILAAYDSASAAAPQDATLHILAATVHSSQQNFSVAAQHLAEAKRLLPNEARIYFIEATMRLDQRDLSGAEQAMATNLQLLDHSLPSYIAAVNLFGARGRPGKAEDFARQAVEHMPKHAPALTLLAKAIRSNLPAGRTDYRRNFAEVEDLLSQAIDLQPDYPNAWLQLGEVQLTTGRAAEAAASFRRAIELGPSLSRAYVGLGIILFRQGQMQQAKACLAKAAELSPDDPAITSRYAELLCVEGSVARAAALLERALISQSLPQIEARLAWLLATCADPQVRNAPRAVRLAESAMAKSQGRPSTMLVLAASYAADDQFPKAIAVAQQALARVRSLGQTALAERLADHLARYAKGQALHLESYDRLEGW